MFSWSVLSILLLIRGTVISGQLIPVRRAFFPSPLTSAPFDADLNSVKPVEVSIIQGSTDIPMVNMGLLPKFRLPEELQASLYDDTDVEGSEPIEELFALDEQPGDLTSSEAPVPARNAQIPRVLKQRKLTADAMWPANRRHNEFISMRCG